MSKKFFHAFCVQCIIALLFPWNISAQTVVSSDSLFLNYLAPDRYLIEDIRITGNKTLEPEVLLAMIEFKAGDLVQIPGAAITNSLKKLWQQKLIQDVAIYASKILDKRITLTIDITEASILSTYRFEGINKKKEQEALAEKLTLSKGQIITDQMVENSQKKLQKYLESQGYLDAIVTITRSPDPTSLDYTQLTINVDKGERFIINKISFQGNHNIDDKVLKAQLQHINEKPRFTLVRDIMKRLFTQPWSLAGMLRPIPSLEKIMIYWKHHVILFSSKFIQDEYKADKKRLVHYYATKGYQDAKIIVDTVYKEDPGLLNVQFQFDEGEQYLIRDIQWVGNYRYSSDALNKILDIYPGDVYSLMLIQAKLYADPARKDVASLYRDDGYLSFNAEIAEVSIENNAVDLAIRIQEGPPAYINQVHIRGNTGTHDHVIRRELRTLPGDKFNNKKLIRSQRDLAILNIFDPHKIRIIPIFTPGDTTVDLVYEVKEAPKFDIKLGTNFPHKAMNLNLSMGVNNFSLRNVLWGKYPFGDAQTLNIIADFVGKNYQNFSFQFIEPWLGKRNPTSLSFVINKSFQQNLANTLVSSWGVCGSLGRRLQWPDDYTMLKVDIGYQRDKYNDFDLLDNNTKLSGVTNDISFTTVIERNSTENPIYPTQGSIIGLHLKLSPPYSWLSNQNYHELSIQEQYKWREYYKWMVNGAYFQQLITDLVLNIHASGGLLGAYSTSQSIGPFERFSMGGVNPVPDISPLRKKNIPLVGYSEYTPKDQKSAYQGGTIFNKFALELRYPLIKFPTYIYALVFAEAGNTWLYYSDWNLSDMKKSVGLGLRIAIPFFTGEIGLYWGYGFDKTQEEDKLSFQFSLSASR